MTPLSPKVWAERIERSKKSQEGVRREAFQFLRAYQGDYSVSGKRRKNVYRDEMNVNMVYAMVELITPSIYTGQPSIVVFPKRQEFEQGAHLYQGVINYWLTELDAAGEFGRAIFDSFFGYAAIEVGWHYETKIFKTKQQKLTILDDGSQQINMEDVDEEKVLKDQPYLKWRDPFDVLFDPDVPRRKDGRFQIIRDIVTYQFFLSMPDVSVEMKQKVRPSHRPDDEYKRDMEDGMKRELKSDEEWVELYWIWDRESEMKYLWTPQVTDEYLSVQPWPYEINYKDDPFPVTILDGKTDPRNPYTFSEIRPLWDHIVERNRLRTAANIHMKRSLPKYIYSKQAGTRSQVAKFFNSRIDEATEMNNPDGLKIAPVAPFPPELYKWDEILKEDFLNISSLSEYQNEQLADTATEASIIEGRSTIRKGQKRKMIEQFIVANAAKLGMLCQQFMDKQQAIMIEGNEGASWINVSKEQIQGEFAYDIEPGIMEPKNEMLHRQQVLKYGEIMASNPQVDQRNLAIEITKAFGLPAEKMLQPEQVVQQNQQAAQEAEEDKTRFKDMDIDQIPDPNIKARVVMHLLEKMGIDITQLPMKQNGNPQQGPQVPSDMAGMPVEPHGGQLGLEPVEGQQMTQPASEYPPQ